MPIKVAEEVKQGRVVPSEWGTEWSFSRACRRHEPQVMRGKTAQKFRRVSKHGEQVQRLWRVSEKERRLCIYSQLHPSSLHVSLRLQILLPNLALVGTQVYQVKTNLEVNPLRVSPSQ